MKDIDIKELANILEKKRNFSLKEIIITNDNKKYLSLSKIEDGFFISICFYKQVVQILIKTIFNERKIEVETSILENDLLLSNDPSLLIELKIDILLNKMKEIKSSI